MKKILALMMIASCLSLVSAKAKKEAESSKSEQTDNSEWKDVGEQGKKALKETGNFFRDFPVPPS